MNIQEEKLFIYSMMKETTEERRKLTDIYYGLKERLDFLNNLEQRGIEDLSLKGYADLHNQTYKEAVINNIKRESEHQIQKIENHHIIEESEKSVIPKEEVAEAVHKENKKRRGIFSADKLQSTTITVLRDAGVPLKLEELLNRVSIVLDSKINKSTFQNNVITKLLEKNKVDRPMRGFYQYRG